MFVRRLECEVHGFLLSFHFAFHGPTMYDVLVSRSFYGKLGFVPSSFSVGGSMDPHVASKNCFCSRPRYFSSVLFYKFCSQFRDLVVVAPISRGVSRYGRDQGPSYVTLYRRNGTFFVRVISVFRTIRSNDRHYLCSMVSINVERGDRALFVYGVCRFLCL